MTEIELFTAALRLSTPWVVKDFEFLNEDVLGKSILHLHFG
jgi:hypothetical protein